MKHLIPRRTSAGRRRAAVLWLIAGLLGAPIAAGLSQETGNPAVVQAGTPDVVTIDVEGGDIAQVLKAFSSQTGKSIVVSPEVTGKVTVRLNRVAWAEALPMILKPYGYDHYRMGETIVVSSQENARKFMAQQTAAPAGSSTNAPAAEPLVTRVFNLKYLDASDIEGLIKPQLSAAGSVGKLNIRSQSWRAGAGWGSSGAGGTSGSGGSANSEGMGRLRRIAEETELVKGKTLVVTDTARSIGRIAAILEEIDRRPVQVLIEAKFVEVRSGLLRDIGAEFGTGATGAETPGVQTIKSSNKKNLYGAGVQQINALVTPANLSTLNNLSSTRPFNAGMSIAFQQLTDVQFQFLLHLLQEDDSFNVLSSPQILTLNNQDASIIVGTKFPIISSQTSSGSLTPTTSTTLEYYENIGIQLKVLPQVCDDKYINLIVQPSVREMTGKATGKVGTGQGVEVSLTEYPVLSTREAETQVLLPSGGTIVIGGLLRDSKSVSVVKVPFLGSIPLIGALFRRETINNEKIDLLIFLTATVREEGTETAGEARQAAIPGSSEAKVAKLPSTPAATWKQYLRTAK